MRKLGLRLFGFILLGAIIAGCNSDSDDPVPVTSNAPTYSSIATDMRACAPDLSTSATALSLWASGDNGWSGHVAYGVLKKHFNASSGAESLYATVLQVDQVLSEMFTSFPETVWTAEGRTTEGDWTFNYEQVSGDVTLPSIFGGTTVSDFQNYITMSGTAEGAPYEGYLYFKRGDTDNIEKVLFRFQFTTQGECGAIYAIRNTSTKDITVWTASHKATGTMPVSGSSHVDTEFRSMLYFEGNTTAKTFKFKLKTDAAQGWAMWGGGSTASDSSVIAVRGTDSADSDVYANNGTYITDDSSATYYVMLTFGDMKDSTFTGGGYPKEGTSANLGAETDAAAGYLILGNANCLHADLTAVRNLKYPEEKSELGFAG